MKKLNVDNSHVVSLRIPKDDYEILLKLADEDDRTVSYIIRKLISKGLKE